MSVAENGSKVCFVTVGTTSFDPLISAMDDDGIRRVLVERFGITHLRIQYGRGQVRPTESTLASLKVEAFDFKPTLAEEMKAASLIVSHAGAGSVMEALRLGRPLIVVVNDALMDNHQVEIAEALEKGHHLAYAPSPKELLDVLRRFNPEDLRKYPNRDTQAFARMLDREMGL